MCCPMKILRITLSAILSALLITPAATLAGNKKSGQGNGGTRTERQVSNKTKSLKSRKQKAKVRAIGKVSNKTKRKIKKLNTKKAVRNFTLPEGESIVFE